MTAKSEINGAPGPASGRPVSRPRSINVAASASSATDVLAGPFRDLADGGDLLLGEHRSVVRISASSSSDRDTAVLAGLGRRGGEVEEGCGPEIHETYSIWNIRHNQTPRTRLWTGGLVAIEVWTKGGHHATTATPASTSSSAAPGQGRGDSAVTNGGEQPRPS